MITTIVAFVISVLSGVAIYFAAQWGLFFAGLTAGGITTVLTIVWLVRIIVMLKRAILALQSTRDHEKRMHLFAIQRVTSAVERAKTQNHRNKLLTNLKKYRDEFVKEVRGASQVIHLANEHDD